MGAIRPIHRMRMQIVATGLMAKKVIGHLLNEHYPNTRYTSNNKKPLILKALNLIFMRIQIANERTSPPNPPARKSKLDRTEQNGNGGPRPLGPTNGPPTRIPPRAPSALSYDHGGDTGSDIYVTSAAYKAPSEIRYVPLIIICKIFKKLIFTSTQPIQRSPAYISRAQKFVFGG